MNNKSFLKLGSSGALYFTPEKIKYAFCQRNKKPPTKKSIKAFWKKMSRGNCIGNHLKR